MTTEVIFRAENLSTIEKMVDDYAVGIRNNRFRVPAIHTDSIQSSIEPMTATEVNARAAAHFASPLDQKQKRTRKNTTAPAPVAPSIAQEPEAPAAIITESQVQVDNGASETPATPSGANSPETVGGSTEVAASAPAVVVTFDAMKAKLQEVAAHFEGDTGLAQVTEILSDFGVRKVKEVKPEDFAAVVAQCVKVLQS